MKLTQRTLLITGIIFFGGNLVSAILCWHQFGSPVMPCLNMFAAGICASELVEVILS